MILEHCTCVLTIWNELLDLVLTEIEIRYREMKQTFFEPAAVGCFFAVAVMKISSGSPLVSLFNGHDSGTDEDWRYPPYIF